MTEPERTAEQIKRDKVFFDRLLAYSGIPEITESTHRLETFEQSKGTKKAFQEALNYIMAKKNKDGSVTIMDDIDMERPEVFKHHFITFVGEPGRGKTHLALGLGWYTLIELLGMKVKYWQVEQLLDKMRQEYNNPPDISVFEQSKNADLLILDDLGAEKATEWATAKLDELIDNRYINGERTVFTTNLQPNQLPKRIQSRLKEGIVVTLEGEDYRLIKARRRG